MRRMRVLLAWVAVLMTLVCALVVEAAFDSAIAAWVAIATVLAFALAHGGGWLGIWFSGD